MLRTNSRNWNYQG